MSATKNKAIDKLNEPAKPTAARKKAIKKAVTAVVEKKADPVIPYSPRIIKENFQKEERERQAVEVAPEPAITVIPEPILPDSSQHGEAVSPNTTVIPPFEEIEQPTEPAPNFKQKAASLWARWKWAVYALGIGLLAAIIYDWIHVVQINKQLRQTQQVESKVADEKDSLNRTAIEVEIKHKAVDSALEDAALNFNQAMVNYKEFHAQMNANNPTYKKENNEMQSRIFDTVNNSNDARRQRARELSGQK